MLKEQVEYFICVPVVYDSKLFIYDYILAGGGVVVGQYSSPPPTKAPFHKPVIGISIANLLVVDVIFILSMEFEKVEVIS